MKIFCSKFKEELPALESVPFPGELGERIKNEVSERAWRLWSEDMMIKVINEYRLNLADSSDYETLLGQMKSFLGLVDNGSSAQVLEVENPSRGK
ncbi:MAG TPA: oxidative damage protection protein [Oligoflexia bacterium]|nr:oxidative damage protection protein [Oligoflexia bacterium]HMP47095.1 oxidative damage protection protein [Oligoflexia bacterium]